MSKISDMVNLTFQPATARRWPDVATLFGERGACGGCWCMVWRLRKKEWEAGKGETNKAALQKIVTSGERPGVLAYCGKQPIGWCAIAPRNHYPSLARSRVLQPIDGTLVWSISCLFVLKPYRRQGVSVRLLQAAVAFAAKRGARIVEGYPIEPTKPDMPAPFIWTGVPSAFLKAGFTEVARRSKTRPIMRYKIDATHKT